MHTPNPRHHSLSAYDQKLPDRRKVGDTLTATVEPSDAIVTYSWTLNGVVVGATSTYTVPASATTGDIIAVTVTDAKGNTTSDSVVISGLTIAAVEPTTAAGYTTDPTGAVVSIGYKYVRIFFSEPLDSLEKSDVEIRQVKTKQLYSIESVDLSADGLFADVVLYGSYSGDGTTFLQPNEPYQCTITHNGLTDTLEFELPANAADKVVIAVDTDKNTITTATSSRSNETGEVGVFELGLSYDGNLGQLLGRTVNYAYNADSEISDLDVQDEVVVIDTVKYVYGSNAAKYGDDYFLGSDGTKYYLEDDNKATKNATDIYAAKNSGAWVATANAAEIAYYAGLTTPVNVSIGGNIADGTVFNYAKLILNPSGTVARAFVQETVPTFLKVQSMSDKVAVADKATSMNFDGYTLFDAMTGDLLNATDLEANDNVFYSIADKFGYVYNESVTGELDNVVKGELDIDDETYTWTGAKYYDDGSSKYVDLKSDTDKNSTTAQDYLNSLDPDEVTIDLWLNGKNIAFVDGEVVGASTTTTTTYIITEAAKMAAVGFDNLIKLPVHDGTTASTLTVDPMKLKSYGGKAGKVTGTAATDGKFDGSGDETFTFDYTADSDGANATVNVTTVFALNKLVDVVTDEAGTIVGLKAYGDTAVTNTSNDSTPNETANDAGTIDKDISTIKTASGTFKVNPSTNVWIAVVDTAKDDSVKKMKFSDYTLITKDLKSADVTATANTKDAAVKDLIIIQNDKDTTAFQVGDTATVTGFVTDVKYSRKSDGSETDVLKYVDIMLPDGTTATYFGNGEIDTAIAKGTVVTLTYDKSSEDVTAAATTAATDATKKIYAKKDYSSSTLTMSDGFKLIPDSECLILKKYTEGGDVKFDPITSAEITSSSCGWKVAYWAVSTETGKSSVVNFIVVEDDGTTLAAVNAAIEAARAVTLNVKTSGWGAGVAPTGEDGAYNYTYTLSTPTTDNEAPTVTNAAGTLTTVAPTANTQAGDSQTYTVTVRATLKTNAAIYGESVWTVVVAEDGNTAGNFGSATITQA